MAAAFVPLAAGVPPSEVALPPPVPDFSEAPPCEPTPFPSDAAGVEWEAKVRAWLATLPTRRNATAAEMDEWLDSDHPSPLIPDSVGSLPRSDLHSRILTLHKLLRASVIAKERSVEQVKPKFVRTDQWKPVYSWLESLAANEVVKSKEIAEWLAGNPDVKEQLFSRHSRPHSVHYIQKLHMKMMKKKEKLKKRSKSIQTYPAPTDTVPVMPNSSNIVTAVRDTQLPAKAPTDACKDEELFAEIQNEAMLRYELLSELQNRLMSHFAKLKQSGTWKESSPTASTQQQLMQIPVPCVGDVETFPTPTLPSDVQIGKKRKASGEDLIPPVVSAVTDGMC